jgi:hypothetical protein
VHSGEDIIEDDFSRLISSWWVYQLTTRISGVKEVLLEGGDFGANSGEIGSTVWASLWRSWHCCGSRTGSSDATSIQSRPKTLGVLYFALIGEAFVCFQGKHKRIPRHTWCCRGNYAARYISQLKFTVSFISFKVASEWEICWGDELRLSGISTMLHWYNSVGHVKIVDYRTMIQPYWCGNEPEQVNLNIIFVNQSPEGQ